jgi:hypothetical protein
VTGFGRQLEVRWQVRMLPLSAVSGPSARIAVGTHPNSPEAKRDRKIRIIASVSRRSAPPLSPAWRPLYAAIEFGSEDPADPPKTPRAFMVMLASEY